MVGGGIVGCSVAISIAASNTSRGKAADVVRSPAEPGPGPCPVLSASAGRSVTIIAKSANADPGGYEPPITVLEPVSRPRIS